MRGLKRVLVVDDDRSIRSLCSDVLSAAGYATETASNGMEALKTVLSARAEFDIVLTDVEMPELDGISFYRLAAESRPAMKERFIFMTGRPGRFLQDLSSLKKRCVIKPFSITELMSQVDLIALGPMENALRAGSKSTRSELRFPIAVECEVFEKGGKGSSSPRALPVVAEELSRAGLRVRYPAPALKAGDEISVFMDINSLQLLRSAKVVWTKPAPSSQGLWVSGLRLERPLPVSSIISPLEYDFSRAAV